MEGGGGVEPEAELLLLVAFPLRVHIRVNGVGLASRVPQELKINLVVTRTLGGQLHTHINSKLAQIFKNFTQLNKIIIK